MNKLSDIKNCHVCDCIDLMPVENVPVPDFYNDEDILRNVLICNECDTIHYVDEGIICYEFSCKINEMIGKKVNKHA